MSARGMVLGAMVLSAAGLAACGREADAPRPAEAPPVSVKTTAVRREAAAGETHVPGTVYARQRASVAARVSASVVEIAFREGQEVRAGAVLVRLDDRALRAAVAAAEAGLRTAEADAGRMAAMFDKGVGSRRESEAAEARAAAARAALAAAHNDLSYAVLRAPFAGRVAARRVDVGDVVTPGAPLVEIEGADGLEIRAALSAREAARLRVGQRVWAQVDGAPEPVEVVVTSLSEAGDPATHRFEMRANLPVRPSDRSGAFARLRVPSPGGEARLLVPETAVFRRGGLVGVFVVEEGRAHLRWVAEGAAQGGWTELRAGLAEGERVATDPRGLEDGRRVEDVS
jgi:RND family efflux transporter MFP subunit